MEFNKRNFAELLNIARGDRSINKYGHDSDVDPGYISRLLRELIDAAPSPKVIAKLAKKAYSGVTYEDLMTAAGYLEVDDESMQPDPDEQFFLRAGKLTEDGKKKLYEFLEFVEQLEAKNKRKK